MGTCTSCGHDVTGKKFCPDCGTPVQAEPATATCPYCNGTVKAGAAFCMHCGKSIGAQATSTAASQPVARICPSCHLEVLGTGAFCTNCGQSLQMNQVPAVPAAPAPAFCGSCGSQNNPGARFCNSCGQALGTGVQPQTGPYQQQPSQYQYPSQPYTQTPQYPSQPYGVQPQYATNYPPQQTGYPPQQPYAQQPGYDPMLGQQAMTLRCPVCQAMAPVGTPSCLSCHTSLAGVVPTPVGVTPGQQQGGLGGMLQGNAGKYAMGALGGAAAVIGGEMLLHGVENSLDGGWGGDGYERHHRDEGLLGGLGNLGNDIGLF